MSRALMSSRAVTAIFCSLLRSHPGVIDRVGCVQYRPKRRPEANRATAAMPAAPARELGANRRRRRSDARVIGCTMIAPAGCGDKTRGSSPERRSHSRASARRSASSNATPGRATTTRCASSNISRHRCHAGSPRNASAPTISASGRAGASPRNSSSVTHGVARPGPRDLARRRLRVPDNPRSRARPSRAGRAADGDRRGAVRRIAGGNEAHR